MSDSTFEKGIITRLEGSDAFVAFRAASQESCSKCGAKILCKPGESGQREVLASNPLGASVGSEVLVREKGDLLLTLSFLQYGVPMLGFILGIAGTSLLDFSFAGSVPEELFQFGGGLVGLVLGGFISWIQANRMAEDKSSYFEIAEIIQ